MTGLTKTAVNKKMGLTLGEVATWVEQARMVGFTDDALVQVTAGLHGQLVEIGTR